MNEIPDLPTHCAWCGAYLQGGATVHRPDCWVTAMVRACFNVTVEKFEEQARYFKPLECMCRTCGCVAADHEPDGSCLLCGRHQCWS
jgi:hypothetical protein